VTTDWAGKFLDLAMAYASEQGDVDSRSKAIAELFCAMTDDGQAQFFVHAAAAMAKWERPGAADWQALAIGRHLRDCECSTEGGREFIRSIIYAMDNPPA
jgi:hypothetical protein